MKIWCAVAALVAAFLCEAHAATPLENWRASAEVFERFLATRATAGWMHEVTLSPDGSIFTTAEEAMEQLSLDFWHEGAVWLSSGWANEGRRDRGGRPVSVWSGALPGRHAVVFKAVTPLGYQHVTPLCWVEVTAEDGDRLIFPRAPRKVSVLQPPAVPEECWPNDRVLAWLDWQILGGGRHIDDIDQQNHRTPSAVFLQVDFCGRIYRKLVPDPAAERDLCWLIYQNGHLIRKESAAGVLELDTAVHGMRGYIVLAGIETPQGFFPVSNQLCYALAPQVEDGLQLVFRGGRDAPLPKWFAAIFPPPTGSAPEVYDDPAAMKRARTIMATWTAAGRSGNSPFASWLRLTPELADFQKRRGGFKEPVPK